MHLFKHHNLRFFRSFASLVFWGVFPRVTKLSFFAFSVRVDSWRTELHYLMYIHTTQLLMENWEGLRAVPRTYAIRLRASQKNEWWTATKPSHQKARWVNKQIDNRQPTLLSDTAAIAASIPFQNKRECAATRRTIGTKNMFGCWNPPYHEGIMSWHQQEPTTLPTTNTSPARPPHSINSVVRIYGSLSPIFFLCGWLRTWSRRSAECFAWQVFWSAMHTW